MHLLLAILIFTTAIALMAVGVMFKRKAIRGSCGALAKIDVDSDCSCREGGTRNTRYQSSKPQTKDTD